MDPIGIDPWWRRIPMVLASADRGITGSRYVLRCAIHNIEERTRPDVVKRKRRLLAGV
jgi:hypothetical protein